MNARNGTVAERLRLIVDQLPVSELSRRTGLSDPTIRNYLKGVKVPIERAAAIARAAGVRLEWLATGEGPMRPGEGSVEYGAAAPPMVKAGESMGPLAEPVAPPAGYVTVPRHAVQAGAGGGRLITDEHIVDWWAFREDWLRRQNMRPDRVCLIEVAGDSMEPTIRPGDVVLVDLEAVTLFREGIWVVWYEGLLLKRLQRLGGGRLKLVSDNPAYEPIVVEPANGDTFLLVGMVRWIGKKG